MSHVWVRRFAGSTLITAAAVGVAIVGTDAGAVAAAPAAAPTPTITGALITRSPHTLAPGSRVRARTLATRTYTDARHGFALASTGGAQYPAATVNGGKTWRTNGPALHLNAAQAPLVVENLAAANRSTVYAYGGGQVIDATTDGGRHWFRAIFDGLSMAVTRNSSRHLVGFIDGTSGHSAKPQTWQYVSKDGGRTWRLDPTVGGS